MDMPWGTEHGFEAFQTGDAVTPNIKAFFELNAHYFRHVFLAFQPKSRATLKAEDYFPAFESFFDCCHNIPERALHHTMLNLAGEERYARGALIEFTNRLVERFDIRWINEDVGIWSLHGKALPYPLPPILTERSLSLAVATVQEVKRQLAVPLILEFPGFTEGSAIIIGDMHAYDYFRVLADETDSLVNLDTGHLISYQYLKGSRGEDLGGEIDRLPLARCFEIHLAGSELSPTGFHDMHHGILLPQQLTLLDCLIPRCSKLHAVTYEDPRFTQNGILLEPTRPSFELLRQIMTTPSVM
ncbi:DUF692 family multinuclear iron-containing protein [Pseudomonas sp.]|uniref:multinuclear nonheme iron-dependent oxidase n=1 Tax=Pseudomonas sp. TaxID=306 RepID=UPI00262EA834|nr:DUF692 family multinuclear iron-containing protein [Pseudomonas sp.]